MKGPKRECGGPALLCCGVKSLRVLGSDGWAMPAVGWEAGEKSGWSLRRMGLRGGHKGLQTGNRAEAGTEVGNRAAESRKTPSGREGELDCTGVG